MASATLTGVIKLNTGNMSKGLAAMKKSLQSFRRDVAAPFAEAAKEASRFTKMVALAAGAAGGIGIHKAFQIEGVREQFSVLLNNTEAGKQRVKELIDLAAKTPFDLGPWIEAARIMQMTGGNELGGNDFLTKLGDTAAVAKQDVQQVAVWTSKLYNSLKSGSGVGVSGDDMMRAGIIRPETYAMLKKIGTDTKNFGEAWKLVTEDLSRFNGGMERFSKTGSGMLGIFRGLVSVGVAQMFEGLGNKFKDAMYQINAGLMALYNDGTFTRWGEKIASAFKSVMDTAWQLIQAWRNLNVNTRAQLLNIGAVLGAVLVSWKAGFLVPLMKGIAGLVTFAIAHAGAVIAVLSGLVAAIAGFKLGRALGEAFNDGRQAENDLAVARAQYEMNLDSAQKKMRLRLISPEQYDQAVQDAKKRYNKAYEEIIAAAQSNSKKGLAAKIWGNVKKEFSAEGFKKDIESAIGMMLPQSVKDFLNEMKSLSGIEFPEMPKLEPLTGQLQTKEAIKDMEKLRKAADPIRGIYARFGRLPRPSMAVAGAREAVRPSSSAGSDTRTVAALGKSNTILGEIRDNTKKMSGLKLAWG